MPHFKYVGEHADTVSKGDKLIPVAPGDVVTLTEKEAESNNDLALISVPEPKKKEVK